jgi:hypothetical protein
MLKDLNHLRISLNSQETQENLHHHQHPQHQTVDVNEIDWLYHGMCILEERI